MNCGMSAIGPSRHFAASLNLVALEKMRNRHGLLAWHIILIVAQPGRKRDPDASAGEPPAFGKIVEDDFSRVFVGDSQLVSVLPESERRGVTSKSHAHEKVA